MILTGPEIEKRLREGTIKIDPFDVEFVNPASVDLRLGPEVFVYDAENGGILDPFQENPGISSTIGSEFQIQPHRLYLMHTLERIWAADLVGVIDGKSTLGRLGISVHQTAGYIDPGFHGQPTLEVTCILPTRLRVGMRIAQLRFHETAGLVRRYTGSYTGLAARGAVRARPLK